MNLIPFYYFAFQCMGKRRRNKKLNVYDFITCFSCRIYIPMKRTMHNENSIVDKNTLSSAPMSANSKFDAYSKYALGTNNFLLIICNLVLIIAIERVQSSKNVIIHLKVFTIFFWSMQFGWSLPTVLTLAG